MHGLLRTSLVPPAPIRRLRDLTRTRTTLTRDRAREVQRIEKNLEDAGIKTRLGRHQHHGTVPPRDAAGVDRRNNDPATMADPALKRLRSKILALTEALTGRLTAHHGYLIQMRLNLFDAYATALADLETQIVVELSPSLLAARDLLCSIPGWSTTLAEAFSLKPVAT